MKFTFDVAPELLSGIRILKEFFPIEEGAGVVIKAQKIANGLRVIGTPDTATVYYGERSEFYYGLSFCMENYAKAFTVERAKNAERVGVMRDCARNAPLSVAGGKKLLASLALIGYNYLGLYVEDLMDLEDYQSFGSARGKYTSAEIKELDGYAQALGMELMPCIQTLAHLPAIFKHAEFVPMHDRDDILLVDEEKTYDLIEKMVKFCHDSYTSRRINIGMDEAQSMFLGKYLQKHGYQKDRMSVFLRHLNRVIEICRKYGFKPAMWSDMIFKAAFDLHENESYLNLEGKKFDSEFAMSFPKDVTLVFWDYYHQNRSFYDQVFKKHFEITNNVSFAGGVWTWVGFSPCNTLAEKVFAPAYNSGKEVGCKDYMLTAWGDDGGECSTFMALSSLAFAADKIYGGTGKGLNDRFTAIFGNSFDDFKKFEDASRPFKYDKKVKGKARKDLVNVSKYALYNDPLIGKLDGYVTEDMKSGFVSRAREMKRLAGKGGAFSYLYNSMYHLCNALALKATLGLEITAAYKAGDKEELKRIAQKVIPQTVKRIEEFYNVYRRQWNEENKPFGFEVIGIRIGGVILRLKETATTLKEYISGVSANIPELDARLAVEVSDGEKKVICFNSYQLAASASKI